MMGQRAKASYWGVAGALFFLILAALGAAWQVGVRLSWPEAPQETLVRWALSFSMPALPWQKAEGGGGDVAALAFRYQLPYLSVGVHDPGPVKGLLAEEGEDPLPGEMAPLPTNPDAQGAQVLIYNTHNGETYGATDGKSRRDGENAGVVQAAAVLAATLQDGYGLAVARSETIHDFPSYNDSYVNSLETFKALLTNNPGASLILDIHRDAAVPERGVVTIDGKPTAKILFIVGTDARAPHPHWQKNLELANAVHQKLEALYPGLSRGVRTKDGRYHQQLHPGAMLIEIGSDKNSLEEAENAARCLARALAEILAQRASPATGTPGGPTDLKEGERGLQASAPFSFFDHFMV